MTWLGTRHGMENMIVPQHDIPMDRIAFSGLRGKGWPHTLLGVWRLLAALLRCFVVLGRRRPDVVLGMGGYVTVPGGISARLRGIPLVLVNADAALLLSNRILTPLAHRVLFGFPADFGSAAGKARVTGNPVRREIILLAPPAVRYAQRSGPLRVLVLGGSLGARVLNEALPPALAALEPALRPQVVHQSGRQHLDQLRQAYRTVGVAAEVLDFIDDMPARYAAVDLVICRAGAITVSELTAAGVASVLVPLVAATTTHQRDNAQWMARQQAAIHLPQSALGSAGLTALLAGITRERCRLMAQAAYQLGRRDANDVIADELEGLTATT